ncbi:MAG: DUF4270 domain-containing protein [Bacteroides sp.]|nr:DUF4270 domain-containing protein [Roseburia sp.]MCM1346799.1 DUF4270 domain-containing protein [Bacteroides sp.]MCM1420270.1 DUF4270 domain-containing protein [Bacteroides sp.]
MKLKSVIAILFSCVALVACDDTTDSLGIDMMPSTDLVTKHFATYGVTTESYSVGDSVLARSSRSYLGRFTDPETETIVKSDFLAQFYCTEGFAFPDTVIDDKITKTELRLYIDDYIGDSLASFKLSVYPLTKVMDPEADYYTNIDPSLYCDLDNEPIAVKWFTIADNTVSDDDRWSSDYYNNINIPLPESVGQTIYDEYRKNPDIFRNTETWINSGLPCSKGFYFKIESGDGAMTYIDIARFNLYFRYYDNDYGKDTLGVCQFAATEEVVQATRFENQNLNLLLDKKDVTYLKSPAGIFTLVTLPTEEINFNDTINSARLVFTRYNDQVESKFKLGIPQTVLLVRLDDYINGYFEKYSLADSKTSYLTSFNSSTNTYEFSNISLLLTQCLQEKKSGTATENWNKVLLIPVEATFESGSTSSLVKLSHDFSMGSAKLVGGVNDKVNLEVIYSNFNEK